jgi:hypothetical protein
MAIGASHPEISEISEISGEISEISGEIAAVLVSTEQPMLIFAEDALRSLVRFSAATAAFFAACSFSAAAAKDASRRCISASSSAARTTLCTAVDAGSVSL